MKQETALWCFRFDNPPEKGRKKSAGTKARDALLVTFFVAFLLAATPLASIFEIFKICSRPERDLPWKSSGSQESPDSSPSTSPWGWIGWSNAYSRKHILTSQLVLSTMLINDINHGSIRRRCRTNPEGQEPKQVRHPKRFTYPKPITNAIKLSGRTHASRRRTPTTRWNVKLAQHSAGSSTNAVVTCFAAPSNQPQAPEFRAHETLPSKTIRNPAHQCHLDNR